MLKKKNCKFFCLNYFLIFFLKKNNLKTKWKFIFGKQIFWIFFFNFFLDFVFHIFSIFFLPQHVTQSIVLGCFV